MEQEFEPTGIDSLPIVEGVDWNYAWLHLPDMELLAYTMNEFVDLIEELASELEHYYCHIQEEGMLENFCIRVHGMKSSAALLGIVPLAGMAKILEYAAKNHNMERIYALTTIFLEEWRSYQSKLQGIFHKEESML